MANSRSLTRNSVVTTPLTLSVRTANGRVRIKGTEGNLATVNVTIEPHHGEVSDEEVQRIAEGIVFAGDSLTVESPDGGGSPFSGGFGSAIAFAVGGWRSLRVSYDIEVPLATKLELACANGPVDIADLGGALELKLANGPLRASRCGGAVKVRLVNGPLKLDDVGGPLEVSATNGPTHVQDVHGDVEARVLNGPFHYSGAVAGNFDLEATNGPLVLKLPADSRFEVDAEAQQGSVHSDFAVSEGGGGASGSYKLQLRTRRGHIHLQEMAPDGVREEYSG